MKLVLENFRSHEKASFDFPQTGFVKVDGQSGAGKSNVFKALRYCLYGKQNNAVRYGADGCRVDIETTDLKVSRGKGPTLFMANDVTGETGQGLVHTALGMNELEFEVSSYIAQDQANSFIHCKPIEQMELLQRLAFHQDNPETLKEKTKLLFEEADKTAKSIQQEKTLTNNTLTIKREQLQALLLNIQEPDTPEIDIQKEKERANELQKEAIKTKGEIFGAENNLKNPLRERVLKAQTYLESLLPLQNEQRKWFSDNPETSFAQQNELIETQSMLAHLQAQTKEFEEMQKRVADRNGCERKVQTYGDQLQDLIAELDEHTVLASATEIYEISGKYVKAKKDLDAADGVFDYLDNPATALESTQQRLICLQELQKEWIGVNAIREQQKKTALDTNIGIDKAKTFLTEHKDMLPAETVNAQLEKLREKLATTEKEYNSLSANLANATNITKLWNEYRRKQTEAKELQTTVANINEKFESQNKQAETIGTRCAKLKRFLELIQKAALSALDARIAEINIRAEHWLEVLFNGTIQASIETEKEAKNGNVSHKINLSIYENGTRIDKKEELSGGQQSRLALAFQLALSDMYRSPVLMLDESLKGCDTETSKICLEAIRQIAERKLVLMVEHHVEDSQFDKVVSI